MTDRLKLITLILLPVFLAGLIAPGLSSAITIKEEEEIAREAMRVIFKRYQMVKDPFIVDYVNRVGEKILAAVSKQPFNYEFFVFKHNIHNAFAIPAGKIFISSSLIAMMESEEELAGILAHEIAHVVCRHISGKIKRSKKLTLATLAGIVAGVLLGGAGAGELGQAVMTGSIASTRSAELAMSREDEMQADQVGLKYLIKAGYTGEGLPVIMDKMRKKRWYSREEVPTYLVTHPALEDRMVYLSTWIEARQNDTPAPHKVIDYEFKKANARILALYEDESVAIKRFESILKENPSEPMALYGYGLVMAKSGNWQRSAAYLRKALNQRAFDADILKELGSVYFLDGRYADALNMLEGSAGIQPDDRETLYYLGRTHMELGRLAEAERIFRKAIDTKDVNIAKLYFFLGQVCGRQGLLTDAHFYLGIYYGKIGEKKKAIIQLERALEKTTDSVRREEIEKRLAKLKKKKPPKKIDQEKKSGIRINVGRNAKTAW